MTRFFQQLLSADATYSFGRFMSLVITAFVLGWDTSYIVYAWHWNHHLSANLSPVPVLPEAGTLAAQGIFCLLFYGSTKVSEKIADPPKAGGQ